jgi:hypothetical protein
VKSIVLVLGVGLATIGLTNSASAQYPCPCSQTVYYSYPTYTPVYNGGAWNTGYSGGHYGSGVYVGGR